MKKLLLTAICFIAGATMITSCDPNDILGEVMGDASLTVSSNGVDNFYTDGQTLSFTSCVADFIISPDDSMINNVCLGANINLLQADVISNPYMGINVNDTAVGTYTLDDVLVLDSLLGFNGAALLNNSSGRNVFVVMASDTCFYVSKNGTITITEYPTFGSCATGTINNANCYYVTETRFEYVKELIRQANEGNLEAANTLATTNIEEFFPIVTFNGQFNGRRIAVGNLINSLGK